jgi:hypothetical protein
MDVVLPVLTFSFLEADETEEIPQTQHHQRQLLGGQDNTHRYLTDRWSNHSSCGQEQNQQQQQEQEQELLNTNYDDSNDLMWIVSPDTMKSMTSSSLHALMTLPKAPALLRQREVTVGEIPGCEQQREGAANEEIPNDIPHMIIIRRTAFRSINGLPLTFVGDGHSDYPNGTLTVQDGPTPTTNKNVHTIVLVDDENDDVSVLADNPDDDDVDVLPHSTYDVLANIFDQIYKDDSEVDE